MKAWTIALNTFREAIRNRILYSVALFFIFLVALSAFFGAVTIGDQVQVIKDFGLFGVSLGGALVAMLLGVTMLRREQQQKTIYNILSKPISRTEFLVGKHLGLSLTVAVVAAMMGIGLVLFVAIFERRIDWHLFQGIGFAILEGIVVSAVVLFFSSLAVTTVLPGILTLATYVAGHSLSSLTTFAALAESQGTFSGRAIQFVGWIIPDLSMFNANATIVYGQAVSPTVAALAGVYAIGYSAVAVLLASAIITRRELL